MKKISVLVLFALVFASGSAFAARVTGARLDAQKKNVLVDVVYSGGCGEHQFSLKMGACLESMPVQCTSRIVETTDDPCEAILAKTVKFSLRQYGLTEGYYQGGSLAIRGDYDSVAYVTLP